MKTHINLFMLACLGIAVIFLSGMDGCSTEEELSVAFLQATPATGSTIQKDATIIAVFDGTPTGLSVTGGKFTLAGSSVTIVGPFTSGALNLVMTWADSATVLTYTVAPGSGKPGTADTRPPPDGMVLIPAGEFEMGSNDGDAQNYEQPVHTVYVDAFYMDEHEVTNLEYKEFLLENPRWQKDRIEKKFRNGNYLKDWNGNNYPQGKANHPVTWVSWYAAMAYAQRAEKRLPTEAEWEYAARGGLKGKKYPNGNTITPRDANYGNNVKDTTAVGKYPANDYELYDMAGNVWEWCLDEYDADFYFVSPRENPVSGANSIMWILDKYTGVKSSRVLRGGSWFESGRSVRVATRGSLAPAFTDYVLGFRCARSVSP